MVLLPVLLLWTLFLLAPPAHAAEIFPVGEWTGPAYIVTGVGDCSLILDGRGPDPDFSGYPLTILSSGQGRDLAASAAQPVTVRRGSSVWTGTCAGQSFAALLQSLGAFPSPEEGVLVKVSLGHIELTVSSQLTYYDRHLETSYYQTIRRENPALAPGEERVAQVGCRGEKGVVYEVEWSNGAVAAQHMVELLDNRPVDEIIEYGPIKIPVAPVSVKSPEVSVPVRDPEVSVSAKAPEVSVPVKAPEVSVPAKAPEVSVSVKAPEVSVSAKAPEVSVSAKAPEVSVPVKAPESSGGSVVVRRNPDQKGGILILPSGKNLRFSKSVSMTATAYTTGYDGVGTITASGTTVHTGVVAVDPKVIPLGTKLYIVANGGVIYGEAVAEDTGVRGNRIDLYMNTYRQCINFGRRGCIVYILE